MFGHGRPREVVDAVTDFYVSDGKARTDFAMLHPVPLPETGMAELVTRNAIRYADDVILNKRDLLHPRSLGTVSRKHHALESARLVVGNESRQARRGSVTAAPPTHPRPTTVQFGKGARSVAITLGQRTSRGHQHKTYGQSTRS